jgi:hypothetical protein
VGQAGSIVERADVLTDFTGYCTYPEACQVCIPPRPEPIPGRMVGAGGAGPDDGGGLAGESRPGGGGPIICPPMEECPLAPMMMLP